MELIEPIWEQQPNETSKAFEAFRLCRDKGTKRGMLSVYQEHINPGAKAASGAWIKWARVWEWPRRFEAYDRNEEARRAQAREQVALERYQQDLEDYRKMHENAGKSAFNNVMVCSNILQQTAKKFMQDPSLHPKTYAELKQLSGVISDFMKYGPQVWADALGIPQLKEVVSVNEQNNDNAGSDQQRSAIAEAAKKEFTDEVWRQA